MVDQNGRWDLQRYAGKWIAWNRDQTRIVATGETFAAVKTAAAKKGEQSVLVAEVPARPDWLRRSYHLLHVFAVFIALSQPIEPLSGAMSSSDSETAGVLEEPNDEEK